MSPGTDFNFRRHRNYLNESNSTHIFFDMCMKINYTQLYQDFTFYNDFKYFIILTKSKA